MCEAVLAVEMFTLKRRSKPQKHRLASGKALGQIPHQEKYHFAGGGSTIRSTSNHRVRKKWRVVGEWSEQSLELGEGEPTTLPAG